MAMTTTRTVDQTTLRTRSPATIMLDSNPLLQVMGESRSQVFEIYSDITADNYQITCWNKILLLV